VLAFYQACLEANSKTCLPLKNDEALRNAFQLFRCVLRDFLRDNGLERTLAMIKYDLWQADTPEASPDVYDVSPEISEFMESLDDEQQDEERL